MKGTIPAMVSKMLGSEGTSEALGVILCPLLSKNFKKLSLISLLVM
jgi:hypothetical protein